MSHILSKKWFLTGAILFLAVIAIVPFVSVEAGRNKMYVNKDASGTQDGSSSHPYKTIWQALDKADARTDIFVAKGEYKENITIGKDIRVYGAGKDKTTIKSADDDEAVVTMKHKARIESVTIKGGKVGIIVKEDSRADIIKTIVKDNDREGILIFKGDTDDDHKVSIVKSLVKGNDRSGIYAKKRKVIVMESTIQENTGDGIVFEKDVTAWLEDNTIKENKKSGVVAVLDKSSIGLKKNSVYKNTREGMEISSFGEKGNINVDKSKVYENGRYGIARVSRGTAPVSLWSGLTISANTQYWGNVLGNLSGVVRVK